MSKTRQAGPDLLRCLALLGVVTFHSFLFNGYYYQPQTGAAMAAAGSVRWLSVTCVGLFCMLTGYFRGTKPLGPGFFRGLLPVLLGYLLAAAASIPARHFLFGDVQSLSTWTVRFFSFSGVYYGWYVGMYLCLILLSPLLNLALAAAKTRKELAWLVLGVLAVTALPRLTPLPLFPEQFRPLYPAAYYLLGAAVAREQPKVPWWAGVGAALLIAVFLGTMTTLSTDGNLDQAWTLEFGDIWIVLMTVSLFVGLYDLPLPRLGPALAWAAGGCYGGYLLSHLLDGWVYARLPQLHRPEAYPLLFLCVTLPIFLLSLLAGKALDALTRRLLGRGTAA